MVRTEQEEEMNHKFNHLTFLQNKIDRDIGYNYWKKYVASAFWSQVSTPINLTITFLTAITTAQAQSQSLISENIFSQITIVSLIITTLNTFFRPHTQFSYNTELLQKWNDVGIKFEKEYYKKAQLVGNDVKDIEVIGTKIKAYETIQDEVNTIRKSEGAGAINFLTDIVFLICYNTCIRSYKRWLDLDHKIEIETAKILADEENRAMAKRLEMDRLDSKYRIEKMLIDKEEEDRIEKLQIRVPVQPIQINRVSTPLQLPRRMSLVEIRPPESPLPPPMLRIQIPDLPKEKENPNPILHPKPNGSETP